ncbi:MAG: glycine--tRNA ligase [Nanoarchaeota archaeon]
MFVTKKKINGKEYFYLRESKRLNGKIKAVTLAYLGKTKIEAIIKAEEFKKNAKKFSDDKLLSVENQNPTVLNAKGFKDKILINKMSDKIEENIVVDKKPISVEELATFCKRRGFVYPSSEIYGGLAGVWDYGPAGVELKNNIKKEWWNFHVHRRDDVAGIDGAIITPSKVWEASGHLSSFYDIAVKCKKCKNATKVDASEVDKAKCEKCGGEFEVLGKFNQLFPVQMGALNPTTAYLRGETAQVIFTNFKLVQENARMSLPFGIAQIGKSFRNEISPREFIFRDRELEQMEMEYFIAPNQACPYKIKDEEILIFSSDMQLQNHDPKIMHISKALSSGIIKRDWHAYWIAEEISFFLSFGVNKNNFRIRQHLPNEKSHYSSDTWDLEYKFPMGWKELQGFADRGNYDLTQHQKFSGKNLEMMDPKFGKVLPEVVCEPAIGVERAFMLLMLEAYNYDDSRQNVVLKLNPKLAPIKVAVFPIVKKDEEAVKISKDICERLRSDNITCEYDDSGTVGKRYARNDEIGTPFCITVDSDSIKDQDVTIRDRNTTKQIRVKISEVNEILDKLIKGKIVFDKAGKLVN